MPNEQKIPGFFRDLTEQGRVQQEQLFASGDGFWLLEKSLADILLTAGVDTFPDREGTVLDCSRFFDDWFCCAVPWQDAFVYGLVKMREQEYECNMGIQADGDTPGVTVSFIAFDTGILSSCLKNPTGENRRTLGMEINRVVAYSGQHHHEAMKAYFSRPQALGAYLVADRYVRYLSSFAVDGRLPLPEAYRQTAQKRHKAAKYARIPDFLDRLNAETGKPVCDGEHIFLSGGQLTRRERLALLAAHTGNVSVHSFAAEVRYHALFLTPLARIRLPLLGSPYASALRADLSIGDKEFQGPVPYYKENSALLKTQRRHHPDRE